MKKIGIIIFFCAFGIVLASCCGCRINSSKQVSTLLNSTWHVDELLGFSVNKVMSDSYTLKFDTKKGFAFGKGDCNKFFSSYVLREKNSIEFNSVGSTKMSCQDNKMENDFLNALKKTDGFIVNENELMLLDSGNVLIVFVKMKNK